MTKRQLSLDHIKFVQRGKEQIPDRASENTQGGKAVYVQDVIYEEDHEMLILDLERLLHVS